MTNLITISASFELEAFHPPAAQAGMEKRTLCATFGFLPDETKPAQAQAAFGIFLAALPSARFFAYRLPDGPLGDTFDLERAGDVTLVDSDWEPSSGLASKLGDWLARRSHGKWVAPAPGVDPVDIPQSEAAAPHLLDSASNWDGPVPQMAGLTRLVRISATSLRPETLVLIPWFENGSEPEDQLSATRINPGTIGSVDLTVALANGSVGTLTDTTARTRTLVLPAIDASSLVDEEDGFLKAVDRGPEIAAALKRLREGAASHLWTFPPIMGLDGILNELGKLDTEKVPDIVDLQRAIWLGVNGLLALFDPVFLALTMATTKREGPFVSALISVLQDLNDKLSEERQNTPGAGPYGPFKIEGINADITGRTTLAVALDANGRPLQRCRLLAAAFDFGQLVPLDKLNDQSELMPVLLSLYASAARPQELPVDSFNLAAARQRLGNSFDRQVLVELGILAKLTQDENEIEEAVRRVLALLGINEDWFRALLEHPDAEGAGARARSAASAFDNLLRDQFNGLDASRHAQGALFEAGAVSSAIDAASAEAVRSGVAYDGWGDRHLKDGIIASRWFAARLGLGATPVASGDGRLRFADIVRTLPSVDLDYLENDIEKRLHVAGATPNDADGILDKALARSVEGLLPSPGGTRFIPDNQPRDIAVQIAVDTDIDDADVFQARFNGVALIVRRDDGTWRYANLAEGRFANNDAIAPAMIHPLQPVPIDRQRSLFLNYAGVPLAARDFDGTSARTDHSPAGQDEEFYRVDSPENLPKERCLPAFSYGKNYSIAAHVVTKAGALPPDMQSQASRPWLPAASIPETISVRHFRTFTYLRTTAIGRVTLTEQVAPGAAARIGAVIDDVVPLAGDYPRASLSASDGVFLDLLRDTDGSGSIHLAKPSTAVAIDNGQYDLVITDLLWMGGAGKLIVDVMNSPDASPEDPALASATFDASSVFAGGSIAFRIVSDGDRRSFWFGFSTRADAAAKLVRSPTNFVATEDTPAAWMRLRLEESQAAISFTIPRPSQRPSDGAPRAQPDSLLMLAPDAPIWRRDLARPVQAVLHYPRMGFLDFDRWFSNADARRSAFPENSNGGMAPADKRADEFHWLAMTAYLGRLEDPRLAALMDAMPDLSVRGLRLTLAPVDGLVQKPSNFVTSYQTVSDDLIFDALGDRPELADLGQDLPGGDTARTHRLFKSIAGASRAEIVVTSQAAGLTLRIANIAGASPGEPSRRIEINVPPGVVARFSVRSLVPENLFDDGSVSAKMIDHRLTQFAVGHTDSDYIFDGPTVTVESMIANLSAIDEARWIMLAQEGAAVVPAGIARSYDLVSKSWSDEVDAWNWRKLASIDVKTQRWRFTGRPIYHWVNPKLGQGDGAVRWLAPPLAGFEDFEAEAFFDRDDEDADIQRKQLEPQPASTVLQSIPWDLPSATLFRHRLTLRSRYAGALVAAREATRPGFSRGDWIRVAMLADRTRLQLTRPQLRALMPLTNRPTSNGAEADCPPVMAILEERPFAHGGLADRIAAEIRTGFGFGFEVNNTALPVHIRDSRKEAGPDPRLSYARLPDNRAIALTVDGEGPIGLTFDDPVAPAPTFANTALLLRPRLSQREESGAGTLEEHFLSIALRRYLDPRWLADDGTPDAIIATPLWVEFESALDVSAGSLHVLRVDRTAGRWRAKVNPKAIDPLGPDGLPEIEIATATTQFAPSLALLHLPLEKGRASLTLLALPGGGSRGAETRDPVDVGAGHGQTPCVLSSFEWQVPDAEYIFGLNGDCKISAVSASPVTSMNWTRTNKAFDIVETRAADGSARRFNVAELTIGADRDGNACLSHPSVPGFLHVHPSLERNPLFVHRHTAVLTTRLANGIGRSVEIYGQARRVAGRSFGIPFDAANIAAFRLITFESPAHPIGTLPGMQLASFDLPALIGDKYQTGRMPIGVSFVFRPLGDSARDRFLTRLSFQIDTSGTPAVFTVSLQPAQARSLCSVHFSLVTRSLVTSELKGMCVFDDGSTLSISPTNVNASIATMLMRETLDVTLSVVTSVGEYWGDLSMLTVQAGDQPDSFSWNWLFTGRGDLEPSEAVTPVRLVQMPEAEARIIAVTPPISVKR